MAIGGMYRIDSEEFPAPITSWEPQVIGSKLNGLPVLNSYYLHTWAWPTGGLEACDMERLMNLFYQQDATGQLTHLETDSYDADSSMQAYGTVIYTDFIIKSVHPATRGFPNYDNVRVVFEVLLTSEI